MHVSVPLCQLTSSSWEIASDLKCFPFNSLSSEEFLTFEGGFDFLEKKLK